MRRKTFLGVVLATFGLATSTPSFSQPRERDHDRGRDRGDDEHRDRPDRRADRGRGEWEREMHGPERYGARGPEWRRGGRVPPAYRDRAYVVEDWRLHRLPRPPRGYEWVQVGPDYVLLAIRTGIVAQIILR